MKNDRLPEGERNATPAGALPGAMAMCAPCGKVFRVEGSSSSAVCPGCGGILRAVELGGPILVARAISPPASILDRPFGKYLLRRELGRGGMGVVYEAWDPELARAVAVKMLHQAECELDAEAVGRLLREARACAKLRHPSIVAVHEIGEVGGRHFFAMDLIEGSSLESALAAPDSAMNFPLRRRVEAVAHVAEALGCAHEQGIVHRDVKPSNVLIDPQGRAVLMDFGLASETLLPGGLTRSGAVVGTPQYMSPELASGRSRHAGPPADVFSLGAVLYRSLAGRAPFPGAGLDLLRHIMNSEPVSPRTTNPEFTGDLETICLRCLEKDPARRYSDGAALAADLRRYLAGEPVLASRASPLRRLWRTFTRPRAVETRMESEFTRAENERRRTESKARVRADAVKRLESARNALQLALRCAYDREASQEDMARRADSARMMISEVLSIDPDLPQAHLLLGRTWEILGQSRTAEACWREAIRIDPDFGPARACLARLLAEKAWLASFTDRRDRGINADPASRLADEAASELLRAIETGSGFDDALQLCVIRALALQLRGDMATSSALCRQGLADFPDAEGREDFHLILARTCDGEEAIACFDRALEIRPKFPLALHMRGTELSSIGRSKEAMADLDEALRLRPDFVASRSNRGSMKKQQGDVAGALEDFDAALRVDPAHSYTLCNRAISRFAVGDQEGGLADMRTAAKLEPLSTAIQLNLGAALMHSGKFEEALALSNQWSKSARPPDKVRNLRAWALLKLGRNTEAVEEYTLALETQPDDPSLLAERGLARTRIGQVSIGVADMERALLLAPADGELRANVERELRAARGGDGG